LEVWVRAVLAVQGIIMVVLGIALFLAPATFAPLWPWQLTPLTGRAVGAWLIGLGIATLHANWENDWQRGEALLVSSIAFGILEFITLARFPSAVNWGRINTWMYVLFLASILAIGTYGLWRIRPTRKAGTLGT
jgi:hypothetical protein